MKTLRDQEVIDAYEKAKTEWAGWEKCIDFTSFRLGYFECKSANTEAEDEKDGQSMMDFVREQEKQGRVVYQCLDEIMSANLDAFVRQPTEGLLWDLNRDKLTCLTWIKRVKTGWVNNYAVALVIEKLKEMVAELNANTAEDEPKKYFMTEYHYNRLMKRGTDNQIALRKFPVILDALLEYRNPKTLRQYRELPELVDEKFNEWCIGYLQQEE